jgi:hypothetical protein
VTSCRTLEEVKAMKAIIRRLIIVAWILVGLGVTVGLLLTSPVDAEVIVACALPVLAVWALQFVLTGIVNPRKLFDNPDGKRDHD